MTPPTPEVPPAAAAAARQARRQALWDAGRVLVTGSNPLVSALLAAAALLLVVLLCRWAFSTDHRAPRSRRSHARPRRATLGGDYGLLRQAARVDGTAEAARLRERLLAAGVRATVAADGVGGFAVVVFPQDLDRARALLADAS